MNDTTRRFPRSTAEALPAERAQWWYPPLRKPARRWPWLVLAALLAAALIYR